MFVPGIDRQRPPESDDLVFACRGRELLVREEQGVIAVPSVEQADRAGISRTDAHFLGTIGTHACFGVDLPEAVAPPGYSVRGLRSLIAELPEEQVRAAGSAAQIIDWDQNNRYCGRCGEPMEPRNGERAKMCSACGFTAFPRISPAIIVAVIKDRKILLANNRRYRASGVYSIIAGFVEPGENLEQAVQREVYEEVGIEVSQIEYFASQPWPFPDSLMVGFTARHRSGDAVADGVELMDARWFTKDELPQIPPHGTISRRIIDWFVEQQP